MSSFADELVKTQTDLYEYALKLCRGNSASAYELVQETFLRAWVHQADFEPGTNLQAWLKTILYNKHISTWKKRRREIADPNGFYVAQLPAADNPEVQAEISDLMRVVDTLPEAQKQTLLLASLGYSYEEIAETLGIALGTVKSRIYRARNDLLTNLE